MNPDDFRSHAHRIVDWMADYLEHVERYPVKAQVEPGEVAARLEDDPPLAGDPMEAIFRDFENIVMPGMTHWQSPRFFAFFPANSSYPSLLAEMLTAALGAQCMMWDTSPAAAELEGRMMLWLAKMIGIPESWSGVIQDTASAATLCALIAARERASEGAINRAGFSGTERFRIYASSETHSSIEKGARAAGFGSHSVVQIGVRPDLSLDPIALSAAIDDDRAQGRQPLAVVATLGTTSTTAIDPLPEISDICARHELWLHIDAAYAGTALVLPEYRHMIEGIERADSFVFNPHKWMFTNFDCSAFFVRDRERLLQAFEILPEYLKSPARDVDNYKDWGVALGRRFRALKLWFVIRSYGVDGIRARLRAHIEWAREFEGWIERSEDFEVLAKRTLNLVCFRWLASGAASAIDLDASNERLLRNLNDSGRIYMTHTKIGGCYALRFVCGSTHLERRHVEEAWRDIRAAAQALTEAS